MGKKCKLAVLLLCCLFLLSANATEHKTEKFDVVIFGATPSGITAAVAATREKARVIVIGPEKQAGGMVTGGLCRTDYGDQAAVGGLAREYFQLCKEVGGADEWYNEPHVFQKAMSEWISGAGFQVRTNERLTKVKMKDRRIAAITTSSGKTYSAAVFIDATYEGDLMAKSGISYVVGRESREIYGETFAGIQHAKTEADIDEKELEDDCSCLGGKAEHYIHGTKMKIGAQNADGSLRKGISEFYPAEGTGDSRIQAYCFRLTVTQRPDIRIPFQKPVNYDPEKYQILLGIIEKYPKIRFSRLVHFGKLPNGKFDMNSSGLQSIDFVGGNRGYPDGDYKTRDRIWKEHQNYQQGLLWFLAHDSRIPKTLQAEVNSWGLCRDEFTDNGNWPFQLYVREARRMAGAYVMTEKDLLTDTSKKESVGLGSFLIDSHHVQYLRNAEGWIETEGTIAGNKGGVRPKTYEIPYSALIPKQEQCENLIVPVCLSASHVAYGSLRMEPVYMILGHASGLAAVMAKNSECPVQKIDIKVLQQRLVEQNQLVHLKSPAINQAQEPHTKPSDFRPAKIWSDTNGSAIDAHGDGVLFVEESGKNRVIEKSAEYLLASSQAGVSPLFFDPASYVAPVIHTNNFSHPDEFKVREGLPNFFRKVNNGKAVTIGYLGGSITRADNQYRLQSAKFIQSMFPGIKISGINAGVSGTGTDLGACRLYDQVLKYNPDLVFVEFAVNGAFPDGMEGIIRQIWKYNPRIDICLIYTIATGQSNSYAAGKVPENILKLEKIADHYALPSVHMGLQASLLEKQGRLIWKSDQPLKGDTILFSADGTHPLEAGGNLYAEAIARAMLGMKSRAGDVVHPVTAPLIADHWEDAKMVDPKSFATFSPDWELIEPGKIEALNQFSGWFPYVMKAEKPGSWIRFRFTGTMLGIFDIGGPEAGQLELELDGVSMTLKEMSLINFVAGNDPADPKEINRFNRYCDNRYRGQCAFVKTKPGNHTVMLKISCEIPDKAKILGDKQQEDISQHPEKYNRSVFYLGKILLRGDILNN